MQDSQDHMCYLLTNPAGARWPLLAENFSGLLLKQSLAYLRTPGATPVSRSAAA
jgi:hypothetical protein